jgi:hypothetical protein
VHGGSKALMNEIHSSPESYNGKNCLYFQAFSDELARKNIVNLSDKIPKTEDIQGSVKLLNLQMIFSC